MAPHHWDGVANSLPELPKGAYLHVVGELRSREYTNGDGTNVQTYDIVASKIEALAREAAKTEASD